MQLSRFKYYIYIFIYIYIRNTQVYNHVLDLWHGLRAVH